MLILILTFIIGLHFISRLTFKLLKERAKTGEELQPYPGDINLPIDLYRQKKQSKVLSLLSLA